VYRDERGRPSAARRGYGRGHGKLRAAWVPLVATGGVTCWRCGQLILKGAEWDLGHDDHDRTRYRGPEHVTCNRAAPQRKVRPDPPAVGAAWW
jgi:hypothetical protein